MSPVILLSAFINGSEFSALAERVTGVEQSDPQASLVARSQEGDLEAFEELVRHNSCRVYRAIMGIVRNVEEAQDATQDTFLKVFEHIGNFQQRSKFSTWLLTIATNTALQRIRERKPAESLDDVSDQAGLHPFQVRAWEADPEELYGRAERRRLVEDGLTKLPSKYRAALVLRDMQQLSTEEAAATLGLGISALKARLFRGRLMLRAALSQHF